MNPRPTAAPLVIVPCGKAKNPTPTTAGLMYTGSYHASCRRAADALTGPDLILILSAKYGLLRLDQVIEPYELHISHPAAVTTGQLREQAAGLQLFDQPRVILLAGRTYTTPLLTIWPHALTPLAGTASMGEQRARLASIARSGGLDAAPALGQCG